MPEEKNFENRVKRFLHSKGIYPLGTDTSNVAVAPIGYYEKRWGGGTFTKSGLPDMHIVVNGIAIDVELKAPTGKPSALQLFTIRQINKCGGIGFILVAKIGVEPIKRYIQNNYPEYIDTEVIDYSDFKNLIERLIV